MGCCGVVLHGLVGGGDKVLRAALVVFLARGEKGEKKAREAEVEEKRKRKYERRRAKPNSRKEFRSALVSLFYSSSPSLTTPTPTHPSMYASIWLCGASCDSGRSQLGSS